MVVTADDESWRKFVKDAFATMKSFETGETGLEVAADQLWQHSDSVDDEILQFCFNTITEIGGSPGHFQQLKNLLASNPSENDLLAFLNS